jgi:K+-sensing histidine kinase KdpD
MTETTRLKELERRALVEEVLSSLRHDVRNKLAAVRNAAYFIAQKAKRTEFWSSDPRIEEFFKLIATEVSAAERLLSSKPLGEAPELVAQPAKVGRALGVAIERFASHTVTFSSAFTDVQLVLALEDELVALGISLIDSALADVGSARRIEVRCADAREAVAVEIEVTGATAVQEAPSSTSHPIARRIARWYGGSIERRATASGLLLRVELGLTARGASAAKP